MDWERQTGEIPVFVSVNLSSAQLLSSELYNDVRAMLAKTQCEPNRIKLELTETVMMENPEQARLVLGKLKDTGVSLVLDDFGTGYSSLAYLTRFPFDTIKLDKALVCDESEKREVMLRSVISMARELGMTVVAEGIETEEDSAALAKLGCQFGQSFLFGPPIGADSVQRMLRERFPLTKRA